MGNDVKLKWCEMPCNPWWHLFSTSHMIHKLTDRRSRFACFLAKVGCSSSKSSAISAALMNSGTLYVWDQDHHLVSFLNSDSLRWLLAINPSDPNWNFESISFYMLLLMGPLRVPSQFFGISHPRIQQWDPKPAGASGHRGRLRSSPRGALPFPVWRHCSPRGGGHGPALAATAA